VNGHLTVDADWVIIDRKGAAAKMTHGLAGSKRLPIGVISSVQVKPATGLARGYILFGLPGGNESKRGLTETARDENAVLFTKANAKDFEAIKAFVEAKIAERHSQLRNWDGEQRTEPVHPTAPTSQPSVQGSEKERKRQEGEARKAAAQQRKVELRDQKQAAATARAQAELKQCGRELASENFGLKTIQIYELGFVKVSGFLGRSANVTPRRLISIEASADVGKKSSAGRAVGAVMTGGLNLLGSNKRGDVYLTIVTDGETYALSETPPTSMNMTTSKKLEAVGNSVLRQRDGATSPETVSDGGQLGGTRERLVELKALLDDGLINQQEFEEKRRALLESL
jgi:hypothetical protein